MDNGKINVNVVQNYIVVCLDIFYLYLEICIFAYIWVKDPPQTWHTYLL